MEYNANIVLFIATEFFNICAIAESNHVVLSKCPNSLLWTSVLLSVFVHFYAYAVAKLDTTIFMKFINSIVFLNMGLFILVQLCTHCTGNISDTYTFMASVCNFVVFAWGFCVNIYQIILRYGVDKQPTTHAIIVDPRFVYGQVSQVENV